MPTETMRRVAEVVEGSKRHTAIHLKKCRIDTEGKSRKPVSIVKDYEYLRCYGI